MNNIWHLLKTHVYESYQKSGIWVLFYKNPEDSYEHENVKVMDEKM